MSIFQALKSKNIISHNNFQKMNRNPKKVKEIKKDEEGGRGGSAVMMNFLCQCL